MQIVERESWQSLSQHRAHQSLLKQAMKSQSSGGTVRADSRGCFFVHAVANKGIINKYILRRAWSHAQNGKVASASDPRGGPYRWHGYG